MLERNIMGKTVYHTFSFEHTYSAEQNRSLCFEGKEGFRCNSKYINRKVRQKGEKEPGLITSNKTSIFGLERILPYLLTRNKMSWRPIFGVLMMKCTGSRQRNLQRP